MLNVVLAIQCRDIVAPESPATLMAEKVESSEIVSLAERKFARSIVRLEGKELGGCYSTTILLHSLCQLSKDSGA